MRWFGYGTRRACYILHRFDLDPFLEFAARRSGRRRTRRRCCGRAPCGCRPGRASDRRATGRRRIGRGSRRRRRGETISIFSPTVSCRQVRSFVDRLRSRSMNSGQQSARPVVSCVSTSWPSCSPSDPPRGSARHSFSASGSTAARSLRPMITPSRVSASGFQRAPCASGRLNEC